MHAWADVLYGRFSSPTFDYFRSDAFTALTRVKAVDRKRAVGTPLDHVPHKQIESGRRAAAAGYQMRRGILPSIYEK